MLPRGQNRVGANRLGAKGEENKRRRKRERGRNRIVFDGVRIVKHACVHKLVDESSTSYPFSLSCQRRGCAILSLAFFRPKEGPLFANAAPYRTRRRLNARHVEKE